MSWNLEDTDPTPNASRLEPSRHARTYCVMAARRVKSFRWSLASKARGVGGGEVVELTSTGAAAAAAAAAAELSADQLPSDDAEVSSSIPSWGGLFTKESRERGVFRDVRVLRRDDNAARKSGWICCASATFGSNYITTAKCVDSAPATPNDSGPLSHRPILSPPPTPRARHVDTTSSRSSQSRSLSSFGASRTFGSS